MLAAEGQDPFPEVSLWISILQVCPLPSLLLPIFRPRSNELLSSALSCRDILGAAETAAHLNTEWPNSLLLQLFAGLGLRLWAISFPSSQAGLTMCCNLGLYNYSQTKSPWALLEDLALL